jgi:starch phosphorylase
MWSGVCAAEDAGDVPIRAITNGVHLPTWIEPIHLQPFLDKYLGPDWCSNQDSPEMWNRVDQIPDETLWDLHQRLKGLLIAQIDARLRERWQRDRVAAGNVVALGALLDPQVLTVGFARRVTGYKRPDLVLWDIDRLRRLLTDPWHPVQIIFSGKAHPADVEGKRLIQKIFRLCQDPESGGRIAFVENYDQQLAAYLVHGVDVWLNTPQPPLEASGTSGMKASVNGVPNLSILDGWWIEGYQATNGWAFGAHESQGDPNRADAQEIYALLEEHIIPLYYQRSDDGIPHGFVKMMKAAIKTVAPVFSARRMVKEYAQTSYAQALGLVD